MTSGMLLPNWLVQRAATSPNKLALQDSQSRWTFADLECHSASIARRLRTLGVQPGDHVAILFRNSLEFAVLVHATPRIEAVLVPLNIRLVAAELTWQVANVGARLLIHDSHYAPLARSIQGLMPELSLVLLQPLSSPDQRSAAGATDTLACLNDVAEADTALQDQIDTSAVATIIHTSGTTGRAKGAMLSYGNHWWSAIGSALNLGTHNDDRWLAALPLFHVGGLAILMRSVIYGAPAVIHESFDPVAVNRAIDEDGITIVSAVSTMLQRMLEARGSEPYPSTLRCVLLGGGPAPQALLEECARRSIPVVQTYGLTEAASQVATLAPEDAQRKLGSAGKPLLPTMVRIDQDGKQATGEVGEILVCGPTVMAGYINRPDATEHTLRDGWLHTGDLGYLDDEGYLYLVNRRNDLIISGGENVYPAEVEAVLLRHPAIEEAYVVAVPDQRWGQVPGAAIKLRPNCSLGEDAVIGFCREQLASYKVPKYVRFTDVFPLNATGKILRNALQSLFAVDNLGQVETEGT
jgi:O-succinylbenzoic acid--CoA ligase